MHWDRWGSLSAPSHFETGVPPLHLTASCGEPRPQCESHVLLTRGRGALLEEAGMCMPAVLLD